MKRPTEPKREDYMCQADYDLAMSIYIRYCDAMKDEYQRPSDSVEDSIERAYDANRGNI